MSSPPPESLKRQLRLFQTLAFVLLLALLGSAGAFFWLRRAASPVAVMVDGRRVTVVRNAAEANRMLTRAERQKIGDAFASADIVRLQKVEIRRVPSDSPLNTDAAAMDALTRALHFNVRAFVILVNGRRSLGLPTSRAASDTLNLVKEHYAQMPPDAEIIDTPKIAEKIDVRRLAIDAARVRPTALAAAPYFWTPPPARRYVVRSGDTGFVIASRHHLSFSDFLAANPGQNLNKLRPGDSVSVQKMPVLLTVRVQKKLTTEEKILSRVPDDQAGLRRVTYQVTYTNGQETGRDVLNMETLEKPQPRTQL